MKQNKTKEIRYLIELYKKETGRSEIDMKELASFAISKDWVLLNLLLQKKD